MTPTFFNDLKHEFDYASYDGCTKFNIKHTLNMNLVHENEVIEYFLHLNGMNEILTTVGNFCYYTIQSDNSVDVTLDVHKMIHELSMKHGLNVSGWFIFGSTYNQLKCPLLSGNDVDIMLITDSVPNDTKYSIKCFDIQTKTVEYFNTHNDGSDELIAKAIHDKREKSRKYDSIYGNVIVQRTTQDYSFGDDLILNVHLDLDKYRSTISSKSSNSWVKAKKKLTVKHDYDRDSSMKSLFHSLLLLHDGIRIAKSSNEDSYNRYAFIWRIWSMITDMYNGNTDEYILNEIQAEFKPMYNDLKSQFRLACPKDEK